MPEPHIAVASTLARSVRRAANAGSFAMVKSSPRQGITADALAGFVADAADSANAAVANRIVVGGRPVTTSKGIAIQVFLNGNLLGGHDQSVLSGLDVWIDHFRAKLEANGLSGSVGTSGSWAPKVDQVRARANQRIGVRRAPVSFVGYRVDGYPPLTDCLRGWQVNADASRRIFHALLTWQGSQPIEEFWLSAGGFGYIQVNIDDVQEVLESATRLTPVTQMVDGLHLAHARNRSLAFGGLGECVTAELEPDLTWREILDDQIRALLVAPDLVDVGVIKSVHVTAIGWSDIAVLADNDHKPVRNTIDYIRNRHLWDEYVIDAAGVCLLTAKHLEHATDLSSWDVEEVARDRFLVKANDLEAWFASDGPPADLLEGARADFGDMIMSWDAILAKPGPYTVTDPSIVGR